jgi:hypothetical protein
MEHDQSSNDWQAWCAHITTSPELLFIHACNFVILLCGNLEAACFSITNLNYVQLSKPQTQGLQSISIRSSQAAGMLHTTYLVIGRRVERQVGEHAAPVEYHLL